MGSGHRIQSQRTQKFGALVIFDEGNADDHGGARAGILLAMESGERWWRDSHAADS